MKICQIWDKFSERKKKMVSCKLRHNYLIIFFYEIPKLDDKTVSSWKKTGKALLPVKIDSLIRATEVEGIYVK